MSHNLKSQSNVHVT